MSAAHGNRQKYESRNPLQRAAIDRFLSQVARLTRQVAPETILDVGCGEGFVFRALIDAGVQARITGIDRSERAIADARRRLGGSATLRVTDALDLADLGEQFDLVMMLEVLEHVDNPGRLLRILERLTHAHLLLSVPREPFFRGLNLLRGRHLARLGNHPEHVNLWGRRAFLDFVGERFDVVEAPPAFPWTLVLARKRRDP